MKDKANVDIAVVLGGDDSFNRLMVQPEINVARRHQGQDRRGRCA